MGSVPRLCTLLCNLSTNPNGSQWRRDHHAVCEVMQPGSRYKQAVVFRLSMHALIDGVYLQQMVTRATMFGFVFKYDNGHVLKGASPGPIDDIDQRFQHNSFEKLQSCGGTTCVHHSDLETRTKTRPCNFRDALKRDKLADPNASLHHGKGKPLP